MIFSIIVLSIFINYLFACHGRDACCAITAQYLYIKCGRAPRHHHSNEQQTVNGKDQTCAGINVSDALSGMIIT